MVTSQDYAAYVNATVHLNDQYNGDQDLKENRNNTTK